MHTDPEIFPDPWTFEPERWIRAAEMNFPLGRYLANFTKGSRQCLGISMARTEIYLTIARLVLSYDMELHGTTIDDLALDHVRLAGYPNKAKKSENPRGEIFVKVLGRAVG